MFELICLVHDREVVGSSSGTLFSKKVCDSVGITGDGARDGSAYRGEQSDSGAGSQSVRPAAGEVIGKLRPRPRGNEFLQFPRGIDAAMPTDRGVHLVMDNVSIVSIAPPVITYV